TDDEGRLDVCVAHGAVRRPPEEPRLEGADLDPSGMCVLECLRRPEEQIHERADERHEPDERRRADEPVVVDPPPRIAMGPVREPEPEECEEEEREVAGDLEPGRVEEAVY